MDDLDKHPFLYLPLLSSHDDGSSQILGYYKIAQRLNAERTPEKITIWS